MRRFSPSLLSFAAPLLAAGLLASPARAEPSPTPAPSAETLAKLATRVPTEGIWIASRTVHGSGYGPDVFVIARLVAQGLETRFESKTLVPVQMGWLDADTLVATTWDSQANEVSVHWFDTGAPAETQKVPTQAFLRSPQDAAPVLWPELLLTSKGEILLSHCLASEIAGTGERCLRESLVRVDRGAAPTPVAKRPRDVDLGRTRGDAWSAPQPKRIKPLEGYEVKVGRGDFDGIRWPIVTCTGGGESSTWPTVDTVNWEFRLRPSRVEWIAHTPPLYRVKGKGTNPIGEEYDAHEIFRACDREPIESFRWLGDGLWMKGESVMDGVVVASGLWTIYLEDRAIGTLPGHTYDVFIAPR